MTLLYISLALTIVGVIMCIVDEITCYYSDVYEVIKTIFVVVGIIVFLITGTGYLVSYSSSEADNAYYVQKYNSLVHQAETNMYNNDNELGKKELANQIQEWNTKLAYNQKMSENPWLNFLFPRKTFENLQYIDYDLLK